MEEYVEEEKLKDPTSAIARMTVQEVKPIELKTMPPEVSADAEKVSNNTFEKLQAVPKLAEKLQVEELINTKIDYSQPGLGETAIETVT